MTQNLTSPLHERITAALKAGCGDADAQAVRIPVQRYTDSARLEAERRLMAQHPLPIAASSQLPEAGDWLSLTHMGTPLLLVRQADGAVHTFLNVCRHRGARVVPEGEGSDAGTFVCPYHAWNYRPDGSLRGLPQSHGFPCLKKEDSGLRRLASAERAGMVWVQLDPGSESQGVNMHLGDLMDDLESQVGLQNPVAFAPRAYEVQANWKLLIDGFFEAYHFKIAHRQTIAHMFADNMQVIDEFGLNRRLYLVKSNFAAERPAAENFDHRRFGNIVYFFFPNTTVLVQPDHAQLSTLEPLDAGRTRVHEVTLIPRAPDSDKALKHWQANVDLYRRTLEEDYALSESIQAGLASGANEALTFGTFEFSAPRFHAQLQQALAKQAAAV